MVSGLFDGVMLVRSVILGEESADSVDGGTVGTMEESVATVWREEETNGSVDSGTSSVDDVRVGCGGSREGSGATIDSNFVSADEALARMLDHMFTAVQSCPSSRVFFHSIGTLFCPHRCAYESKNKKSVNGYERRKCTCLTV